MNFTYIARTEHTLLHKSPRYSIVLQGNDAMATTLSVHVVGASYTFYSANLARSSRGGMTTSGSSGLLGATFTPGGMSTATRI